MGADVFHTFWGLVSVRQPRTTLPSVFNQHIMDNNQQRGVMPTLLLQRHIRVQTLTWYRLRTQISFEKCRKSSNASVDDSRTALEVSS